MPDALAQLLELMLPGAIVGEPVKQLQQGGLYLSGSLVEAVVSVIVAAVAFSPQNLLLQLAIVAQLLGKQMIGGGGAAKGVTVVNQ